MTARASLPEVPESDRTPVINMLLKIIERQDTVIQKLESEVSSLKSEIKRLKKHKQKPKIKPSKMDKEDKGGSGKSGSGKRAGSSKRKKTSKLPIHKTEIIKAHEVPADAKFKGYDNFVVQDLEIKTVNTLYKLERWQLVSGDYVVGTLPASVADNHYGPTLRSYVLHQYHNQGVTQPLLLDQLREWHVDISSGQLNNLLIEKKEAFHQEKAQILETGLSISSHIHVDDTGARHEGKNGYCTHIGNELFAWFKSTSSKSRINFLELLRAGHKDYRIDANALEYMSRRCLPKTPLAQLALQLCVFPDFNAWEAHLDKLGIKSKRHRRIATEGALTASVLSHGFNVDMTIVSDDAGQFNIFRHALCWIHAERKIHELIPLNNDHAQDIDKIRKAFWELYDNLKAYKKSPTKKQKEKLSKQFDLLFNTKTCFETLNQVLKRLKNNKSELLLVLEHPDLPLHNNLSERDIREYVKRRKVSGSTRSEAGRECRDTFASLKKTCKKLGVAFWDYLLDRVSQKHEIPKLSQLMQQAAAKPG